MDDYQTYQIFAYINVVDIVEEHTQTVTYTIHSSRPVALIQLYNDHHLYYSTNDNSDNHSSW